MALSSAQHDQGDGGAQALQLPLPKLVFAGGFGQAAPWASAQQGWLEFAWTAVIPVWPWDGKKWGSTIPWGADK